MKITQKKSKKPVVISVIIIVAIIAAGVTVYAIQKTGSSKKVDQARTATVVPDSATNLNPPSNEESQAGQSTKQDTITKTGDSSSAPVEQSSNVSLSTSIDSGTLKVVANLSNISTDATCSLTLTGNSKTVTEDTVGVQALPSYSTCKGWSIATGDLGTGEWTVHVTVTNSQGSQSSTTKVTIQ